VVDLFQEVEEQLRSDRYRDFVRRAAPIVSGLLALVLLGYLGFWGFKVYQDRNLNAAASAYQKGVDAVGQNDQAGALKDFQDASKAGAPGYKTLALMQEGGLNAAQGKPAEAAALFDQAAKTAPNPILGDLASLRAAQVLIDTAPYAEMQRRLTPLADPKRPYALFAKEALAMAKLMAGKTADARRDFEVLGLSLGAPDDMRQRCQLAVALIDAGETPAAVAAVKVAATMPPLPAANVATPPPGTSSQGGPATGTPPAGAAQ
jgi:hypothetical protein